MTKTSTDIINSFPENPISKIFYYVYNKDMIPAAIKHIIELRGQDYFDEYVLIKSIDESTDTIRLSTSSIIGDSLPLLIYFDPNVFNYKSNGYN